MNSFKKLLEERFKILEDRHNDSDIGGFCLLANIKKLPPGIHEIDDNFEIGPATEAEQLSLGELISESQPGGPLLSLLSNNPYENEHVDELFELACWMCFLSP